jgi:integrase
MIEARRGGFRQFLAGRGQRGYTENSVRTFVNQLNVLLKTARKFGWNPQNHVSEEWKCLLALAAERKVRDIVRHFSLITRTPGEVTVEAVQQWGESKIREGMQYATVVSKKSRFWKLLQRTGLTTVTPPNQIRQEKYGIPLNQMAPKLRAEVQALLKWKQAEFAPSRPKSGKIRAISAESLSLIICQLAGYVINVCGIQPSSFADLVQKHHVEGFVEWVINERGMKGRSIKTRIGMIAAVVKYHPAYASQDYSWFKPLADSIPIEDDSEQKKRKAPRYLEYEVLEAITVQIRAARDAAYKKKRFELAAWLAMEYLMLSWLLILPWRQRNIRECRVGGENPNVFKRKIGPYSDLDKPAWVIEAETRNPDTEFWQIYFSPAETKTGVEVHTLLPRQLIEPLERYLSEFRPILLNGQFTTNLFLNHHGTPLAPTVIRAIVGKWTLKFAGVRTNPHLIRDIFAFKWLKEHRRDFLVLSKMLWHKNVQTTIDIYGARFNVSSGVCAVESWLDERAAKP